MKHEELTALILLLSDEIIEGLDRLCSSAGCTREEMALEILTRGVAPGASSL